MRETPNSPETPGFAETPPRTETPARTRDGRRALRSTGDARTIPGVPQPKQRTQPSLGDPENAPGPASERTDLPRD